jgi:hypothetical protein
MNVACLHSLLAGFCPKGHLEYYIHTWMRLPDETTVGDSMVGEQALHCCPMDTMRRNYHCTEMVLVVQDRIDRKVTTGQFVVSCNVMYFVICKLY